MRLRGGAVARLSRASTLTARDALRTAPGGGGIDAAEGARSRARAGGGTIVTASRALILGIFAVSLIPLLVTPIVPTIDFYNHVGRYFLLTHLDLLPYLRESYAPAWNVLPNLGLDVVALPFFRLLPPLIAAKAIVALIFAVQYGGMLALNKALHGRVNPTSALLAGILLYSYILGWGFANFLLASGLVFWGLAVWIWLRPRLVLATAVCSVLAVLIFFCHGFAFALYGLTLALLEFGRWLQARPRRIATLAIAAAAVAVQAVVPAILFGMAPTSDAGNSFSDQISTQGGRDPLLERLADHAMHQGMAILRVACGPWLWLDVLTLLGIAALLVVGWRKRMIGVPMLAVPALAVLALLCVLTPPSLFAVGKISDRVPLMAAMLLAGTLCLRRPLASNRRDTGSFAIVLGLATILAIRLIATTVSYARYADDFADFAAVAAQAPARAIVASAAPKPATLRDHDEMRCEMYPPLLLPLHGNPVPLFAFPSQQPLSQRGELARRAALEPYGTEHVDPLSKPAPDYPYFIACGYRELPPGRFDVLARRGRFMLLRTRTPAGV